MRRAPLFLCIVVCFAALLFLLWPSTKHPGRGTGDAGASKGQAAETTELRRDPRQEGHVEASAILRMEMSGNVSGADLAIALASLLDRPQRDEISARLALKTAWSTDDEQTAQRLAKILTVTPSSDGKGGIVRASDASPVMAASLANTAASVLRDHFERTATETRRMERDIGIQRDKVEDMRKLLASFIRSGMIIYQAEQDRAAKAAPDEAPQPVPVSPPTQQGDVYVDAKGEFEHATQELSRMEEKRREVKEITIHHILWAEAKARE